MMYIAEVVIGVYPYMDDYYSFSKNFTVNAETKEEAESKIRAHYEGRDEGHGGDSYIIESINFFEHIS